ncbi:hypothetical protein [Gemmobacter denitrificans]|uniref:Uncharacterized protein n=1 Tax=Gemmobacter denitrificans TaxID=3123040 RepID=A0ABU8C0U3_9RHOB
MLQGFAQFQGPDIVVREERLAEGLAFAAAELGLSALAPARADFSALAAIWDTELEDAARDAYQRDYIGYGFGRWREAS